MVISHQVGHAKPEPEIYQELLSKYALDPQQCVFFDDQEVNVQQAQNHAMEAIVCPTRRKLSSPWKTAPDYAAIHRHIRHIAQRKSALPA